MYKIKLIIYHANQDDPTKCSARKLARFGLAELELNIKRIPKNSLLLNPYAEKSLSKADISLAQKKGIVAVDCSWKNAEDCFKNLNKKSVSRSLPFVIAVNPINYGKPYKLTTLEAFITALYILGCEKKAKKISKLYKWSQNFIELNRDPLNEYKNAKDSTEIINIMKQYI
jgi:pre-rRNA-processing protein TSR3